MIKGVGSQTTQQCSPGEPQLSTPQGIERNVVQRDRIGAIESQRLPSRPPCAARLIGLQERANKPLTDLQMPRERPCCCAQDDGRRTGFAALDRSARRAKCDHRILKDERICRH